mmetsp:Transcript_33073/g.80374  ORF Transcript_33073/g.80374 Transcript_33073/m.80374 type:complete len:458 (+) Transcript_33073:173-1546(+)
MVVLTASKYVTRWIGPPLMRLGLDLKGALTRMTAKVKSPSSSSVLVDWICLLPYSQRLLSVRLYDDLKVLENSSIGNGDDDQTTRRLRDQRIEVFEKTFRPVFLPTETWGDVRSSLTSDRSSTAATNATYSSSSSSFYRGWGDDVRLVAWLRREILTVYYGIELRQSLISYPTLRQSPQLVRRRSSPLLSSLFGLLSSSSSFSGGSNKDDIHHDNRSLPSSQTVIKAFGLLGHGGSRDQKPKNVQVQQKDTQAVRRTMIHTAEKLGGAVLSQPSSQTTTGGDEDDPFYLNHVEIPDEDASTKRIPFADIVNLVSGGHTSVNPETLGPLNLLCEEANVYQWWTQEYVTHLGDYLWARACSSSSSSSSSSSKSNSSNNNDDNHRKKKTLIIDIGAGDGLLIRHLTEYIQHKIGLKEAAATTAQQTSAPSSVSLKRKKMTRHKMTSTHQQQQKRQQRHCS